MSSCATIPKHRTTGSATEGRKDYGMSVVSKASFSVISSLQLLRWPIPHWTWFVVYSHALGGAQTGRPSCDR
jgi:hypothetical protein